MVLAVLGACLVVVVPIGLFLFGEVLTGSNDGTIDEYNRSVLSSCEMPSEATLVRSYVSEHEDLQGRRWRSTSFVFAAPGSAADTAEVLDVPVGYESATNSWTCRFGFQPRAWVVDLTDTADPVVAGVDEAFWGGDDVEVGVSSPIPSGSHSLIRIRAAQEVVAGWFG